MMGQPNMLILDEATSSIDTRTELKIQKPSTSDGRTHEDFIVAPLVDDSSPRIDYSVLKDGHVVRKEIMPA